MKKYKVQTLSGDITFSLLSAEDTDSYYHSLLKDNNPHLEEYIFHTITDNQYNSEELAAGIIPLIVWFSLKMSGLARKKFDFLDSVDENRLKQEKNSYFSLYSRIATVLPAYKLEELRALPYNELIELLVFAESVFGKVFTDTKKTREVMLKQEGEDEGTLPQKKGVKKLTKLDLDAIKEAINYNDNSNML